MTKKNSDQEPHLGIFWLVDGKLVIDPLPLSETVKYGDHLTYPRGHNKVWSDLQRAGRVPHDSEYDEYPRGRVRYHPALKEFTILADKCILKRRSLIAQIKEALHLRSNVKLGPDEHYKCPLCTRKKQTDEDKDWDV